MRALVALALLGACHLDIDSKPDCYNDADCGSGRRCVEEEQVCVLDQAPVAVTDVFFVHMTDGTAYGNVLANDYDPDGDTPILISADYGQVADDGTVRFNLAPNRSYRYVVSDEGSYGAPRSVGQVIVLSFPAVSHFDLAPNGSVDFYSALGGIADGSIELVAGPSHGSIAGHVYTPDVDFCGTDEVTYRLHADNDPIDVKVTFTTVLTLVDDSTSGGFGSTTTLDVLANDGVSGLTITDVDNPSFHITPGGDALTVTPAVGAAATYSATYTARDTRGCVGTATASLAVQFPTQVIVGAGLTGDSFDPSQSNDGRYIAFASSEDSLVAMDTNNASDVFVLDLSDGSIERVSVASNGAQANDASTSPSISGDGRYVTFVSKATNLALADTTAVEDVYVHDRMTGETTLVSVTLDGTGSTQPVLTPDISDDGGRIVFVANGARFVPGDTNGVPDVFVRDLPAHTTTRISLDANGNEQNNPALPRPRISGDGRYVIYRDDYYVENGVAYGGGTAVAELSTLTVTALTQYTYDVDIDATGRHVAYSSSEGLVILDRVVDATVRLNGDVPALTANGGCAASVSGRRIYGKCGSTSVSIVVDGSGAEILATALRRPAISADGHWVVFATNEWPGEAGHYVLVRVWNTAAM